MYKQIGISSIFALLIFMSCGKSKDASTDTTGYSQTNAMDLTTADITSPGDKNSSSKPDEIITERKLIKHGEVSFETKSIIETKTFLLKAISKNKGYISNERIEDYRSNPTEILTIRIPNSQFDVLLNEIGTQVGEFDSKKIDVDDVSEEFIDIESRLKNKKQLEAKYQELLAKASSMDDILKIEKEITNIREDIESTEGRLRYLNNQVELSTLIVTYYEEKPASGFHFGEKISDALSSGGTGFLMFIIVIINLWPLWIIGGAIWFGIRKYIKHKRNTIKK